MQRVLLLEEQDSLFQLVNFEAKEMLIVGAGSFIHTPKTAIALYVKTSVISSVNTTYLFFKSPVISRLFPSLIFWIKRSST